MGTNSKKRVILVGEGPTAESAFRSLAKEFDVVAIFRRVAAENDPVAKLAKSESAPVYVDTSLSKIDQVVTQLQPDAVVVSSFDRILPKSLLEKAIFINVHYSLLPKYRGRANVNWAILNGETECGISIHLLVPELDAGGVVFQDSVPIQAQSSVGQLYEQLNQRQEQVLSSAVSKVLNGGRGTHQNEADATYGCTRLPEDGEINWNESAHSVDRLIRALSDPYPGAFTYLEGKKIKVWSAQVLLDAPKFVGVVPGRVVGLSKANGTVDVLTGDGVLRLQVLEGRNTRRCSAFELIKSVKMTLGLKVSDLLDRIERLEEAFERGVERNSIKKAV